MDDLTNNVVIKAERAVETVINNLLPLPRCAKEKARCIELREKVRKELSVKLGPVGPEEIK